MCVCLCVCVCLCLCLCVCVQGVGTELALRLATLRFKTDLITVQPGDSLLVEDGPAAFVLALQQLALGLRLADGCTAELCFRNWEWEPAMVRAYVWAKPILTQAGLRVVTPEFDLHLTDDMLSALLAVSAEIRVVDAWCIELHSYEHSGVYWPWEQLSVERLSVGELVRLPTPMGGRGPRKIACKHLVFDKDILKVGR